MSHNIVTGSDILRLVEGNVINKETWSEKRNNI